MVKKQRKTEKNELAAKIESLESQLKRSLADYQNLEKRILEERERLSSAAGKSIIIKILPVLDTLLLAQKHLKDQGLNIAVKQFLEVLNEEGLKKIETEGKDFDPKLMECVEVAPGEKNKVLEEIRPGFMIGEEIIRPAHVKVGRQT